MKRAHVWVSMLIAVCRIGQIAAQEQQDSKEAEITKLRDRLNTETDQAAREKLNIEISQLDHELDQRAVIEFHDAWIKESDPEKKKEIADRLGEITVRLENFSQDDDQEAAQRALEI